MALSRSLLLAPFVAAQSIYPSNDQLAIPAVQMQMVYSVNDAMTTTKTANVAPLTPEIGLGQPANMLNDIRIKGTIKAADAHSPVGQYADSIVYISCDPNTNSSNVTPSDVLKSVTGTTAQTPTAIVLYSLTSSHCNINGTFAYHSILSMTSTMDAQILKTFLNMPNAQPTATIATAAALAGGNNGTSASGSGNGAPNGSGATPAPTTAVAMSILYSITGIITLLFLVIIATGAVRAHRHPERYGPRVGFPGRPRQSRARGIARAMLEALPIVKFGDPEPVKSANQDIELEEGGSEVHHTTEAAASPATKVEAQDPPSESTKAKAVEITTESGMGPHMNAAEGTRKSLPETASELGCSICTEDFEKGEDVRVLPCNHKFHPACIDPWLLNVSGTCPLCRVDLRPAETNTSETAPTADGEPAAEGAPAHAPPLTEAEGAAVVSAERSRGRVARHLDAILLGTTQERLSALRRLREETGDANAVPAAEADPQEQTRRARLAGILRETFRIRTGPASRGEAVPRPPGTWG